MNHYGQSITWGTLDAPHLFTGHCTSYSYTEHTQRQLMDDEEGKHIAVALHSRKGELHFTAELFANSTFLNLAAGAAIHVDDLGGAVLARRAVESWRLGQRKTASIQATHYPDFDANVSADTGTIAASSVASAQGDIVFPGNTIIYSTMGLGHGAGIVHSLTIAQQVAITDDEPSPDGMIKGASAHGYLRTIHLELLADPEKDAPAVRSPLELSGAPGHAANYLIERCEERFANKRGKMYSIDAVWIPEFH
jgi:hypothetical protein